MNSEAENHWATEATELNGIVESMWLLQREVLKLWHTLNSWDLQSLLMLVHSDLISIG